MRAKTLFLEARKLIPLALVLVSAAIIAIPGYRVESTVESHRVLLTLESFWIVGWAARNRYLRKTHQETVEAVAVAEPRQRLPIIDQAATFTGFIALMILAF